MYIYNLIYIIIIYIYYIFGALVHSSWKSFVAAKTCRFGSGRAGNASIFSLCNVLLVSMQG